MNPDRKNKNLLLHFLVIFLLLMSFLNIYYPWSTGLFLGLVIAALVYLYHLYSTWKNQDPDQGLRDIVFKKIPSFLIVIDLKGNIIWHNSKFKEKMQSKGNLTGNLQEYLPMINIQDGGDFSGLLTQQIKIKNQIYHVELLTLIDDYRLLYLTEIKEETLAELDRGNKPVIGIIQIDNFYEVTESLERERAIVSADIDRLISHWALEKEAFLRKYADDKYLIILTYRNLDKGIEKRFDILDKIRSLDYGKTPLTISMGFGIQEDSFIDLGRLALSSLELALGRGGDQVVIKSPERVWFYGGTSQALEKRTKVKARVIAHTLKDMILNAEDIFIMGHEGADYDSIGASLGMASAVKNLGKDPMIVVDHKNSSLEKMLSIVENIKLPGKLIKPGAAKLESKSSLLIVVDTHKPSLLIDPDLLPKVEKVAVIDHHRRAEEFIENADLIYVEPYASSTSELVTELIQYMGNDFEIGSLEATALLAGITVDTKNFIFQTGVRTFDAAAYLRRNGADPLLVQKLLRDEYEQLVRKAVIIENSQIIKDEIAIGVYPEPIEEPQILTAQGADEMLNIHGIKASFALASTPQGGIVISARSTGDINVQVLMEKLGGGGHLTVAAAQLKGLSLTEAKEQLIKLIEENN